MDPADIRSSLPRPGRALKAVLVLLAVSALVGGILANWIPGAAGVLGYLMFAPLALTKNPVAIIGFFTSGLVTSPQGITHALFSIVGLYFLAPDLERRWGPGRFIRFLLSAVCMGNFLVLVAHYIPHMPGVVRPEVVFGPAAAVEACAFAWGAENPNAVLRFLFFLPLSGKTFKWITVAFAVVALVFLNSMPEGACAPLGGVLVGYLLAGNPSPLRRVWLKFRLAGLQRKGAKIELEPFDDRPRPKPTVARKGGPSLRAIPGGLDDLEKRKPPKDKRYLN